MSIARQGNQRAREPRRQRQARARADRPHARTRTRELELQDEARHKEQAKYQEHIAKKRQRRYQIVALHEQGKSMSQIAEIFGITKQAVHGHIKRHKNPSKNERKMRRTDIEKRSKNPHLAHYYHHSVNS